MAVRQPLQPLHQPRRAPDEWLAIRAPRAARWLTRRLAALPPDNPRRRKLIARAAALGIAAYNRRDLEAVVAAWHPEFEYRPGSEWVEAGLVEESYRGLARYRRYVAATEQVWGLENKLTPIEIVDVGDRIAVLAHGTMRAQASGVPLEQSFAMVIALRDGQPYLIQEYYDHAEALRALGLD